jgi:hypothetical protein
MTRCVCCNEELSGSVQTCPACGARATSAPDGVTAIDPEAAVGAPAAPRAHDGAPALGSVTPGTLLAGRFRVLAFAGRGGMGEVYRAWDATLEQVVAVKCLPAELSLDPARLARLHQEVRLARAVSHPNVCRVYDVAQSEGLHFLTMEWIDGADLAAALRESGRPAWDRAVDLARQICAGVAAAHDQGVIHRDLKPSNIMIDARGVARVAGFGLAEAAASVPGGRVLEGTPYYMSPEQLEGREATAASDIYALGLVLFELFTGRRAHSGATHEELLTQRRGAPPSARSLASELSGAVAEVLVRCLDADPERRPPSAREVAAALPSSERHGQAQAAAQGRADRVAAFGEELAELRRAGLVELSAGEIAAIGRFHRRLLHDLVERYDVDTSERGKQLSLGLRLVSLLGALAFAASAFFLLYRVWGVISPVVRTVVLAAAPILGVVAAAFAARRERGGYFTSMAAAFAYACMAINVTLLGTTFGVRSSPLESLVLGVFALVLAYGFELKLLLTVGLVSLAWFVTSACHLLAGGCWAEALKFPETMLIAGALLLAASLASRGAPPGFVLVYRLLGMALIWIPTVILGRAGWLSYLPAAPHAIEVGYQLLGFAISGAAIWLGLGQRMREAAYLGAALFIVLLYLKFFDWFWDWMPKYLFFLVVAVVATGAVVALARLRSRLASVPEEVAS